MEKSSLFAPRQVTSWREGIGTANLPFVCGCCPGMSLKLLMKSFWRRRLDRAIQARQVENRIYAHGTANAYRLVNAENDWLPGLVVDRYGDWLVIQALTLGIAVRKDMLANLLTEHAQSRRDL